MKDNWKDCLGRPVATTDQPPGFYRYRERRGEPWKPVEIFFDKSGLWHCFVLGAAMPGSGSIDPNHIAFIRDRGPFHSLTRAEYDQLIDAHRMAANGRPFPLAPFFGDAGDDEPPRPGIGDNSGTDPLAPGLSADELPAVLNERYSDLVEEAENLWLSIAGWIREHTRDKRIVISNDHDGIAATEYFKKLRDFAGSDGKVEERRKAITRPLLDFKAAVDNWFLARREEPLELMVAIDRAQKEWLQTKRLAERATRAEALRGGGGEDAVADSPTGVTSILTGATTSISEKWAFRVIDIRKFCAAVASGQIPSSSVQVVTAHVNRMIQGKEGLRVIPGLEIFPVAKINRRG